MKRRISFILLMLVISPITFGCQPGPSVGPTQTVADQLQPTPNLAPDLLPTPVPGRLIRLAWFYKPPGDGLLDPLARNFDFFVLTHKDEATRDWLRAHGVIAPIFQYLLLTEISDPGDCTTNPYGNQVAYKPGDFCQISSEHPGWFLLDQKGNRIQSASGNNYMDPGNPGYREFWLERAREMQEQFGWNGVFIDNLEASLQKFTDEGIMPAGYPSDASYQAAVEGFLAFLRDNYFRPAGRPMSGNIVSVNSDNVWLDYLKYLDAALIESFATSWTGGYRSPIDWERQMSLIELALGQGKTLILVAQGNQADNELQKFAFASYLLIANGNAVFRYSNSDSYRKTWLYSDYSLDLGAPLGPRKFEGLSWRREFTHGYVSVNPWLHSAQIMLKP